MNRTFLFFVRVIFKSNQAVVLEVLLLVMCLIQGHTIKCDFRVFFMNAPYYIMSDNPSLREIHLFTLSFESSEG